jgi:iron complex outermembrane recepter protein
MTNERSFAKCRSATGPSAGKAARSTVAVDWGAGRDVFTRLSQPARFVRSVLIGSALTAAAPAFAADFAPAEAAVAAPAEAQPETGSAAQSGAEPGLEEIVVTARKREETLISVPVVVTAIGAAQLEQRGITNLDSIARVVPQLLIGNQAGSVQGGNIAIRGISGPDSNPFGDQAVSFNIDGLQIAKGFVRRMTNTDLSQVEVLKGPQALLYGKNSPAGIVSIRTADPTKDFEAKATVGYETEAQEYRTQDYISGPITDTLGGRIAGDFSTMRGYLREATSSTSPYADSHGYNPQSKDYTVRGTLLWEPLDALSARAKLSYGRTQNSGPASTTEYPSCPFGVRESGSGQPCGVGGYSSNPSSGTLVAKLPGSMNEFLPDGQNYQDQRQLLGSLEVNYQPVKEVHLTSVTGIYHLLLDQCQNYENDDAILLPSCNPTTDREFSEELRFNTSFSWPLNFAGGLYYSDTRATTGSVTYLFGGNFDLLAPGFGGPTTPALVDSYYLQQDGKAYSGYLQGIYKPIDTVEIDVGGRYSYEKKTLPVALDGGGISEGGCGLGAPGVPCTAVLDSSTSISPPAGSHKSWNDFSPEGTISYRPTQTLTVFGSWKHGFLSGGFNSSSVNFRANPDISYDPEVIKGFEAGVKTVLLDGNLALNAAAYQYKVTGLQVTNFENATSTIRNAGAVKITGVETDANYRTPLPGLSVHGAAAYNHGVYDSFPAAPCYNGQTIALGCNGTPSPAAGGGVVFNSQNLSGTELIRAPKWNIIGGLGYEAPVGAGLSMGLTVDANYTSNYLTDASSAPQSREPSFTLVDSTLRLFDSSETWELAFIGRNLTNRFYWVASPNAPFTGTGTGTAVGVLGDRFASVSRGRELLIQASYRFRAGK